MEVTSKPLFFLSMIWDLDKEIGSVAGLEIWYGVSPHLSYFSLSNIIYPIFKTIIAKAENPNNISHMRMHPLNRIYVQIFPKNILSHFIKKADLTCLFKSSSSTISYQFILPK